MNVEKFITALVHSAIPFKFKEYDELCGYRATRSASKDYNTLYLMFQWEDANERKLPVEKIMEKIEFDLGPGRCQAAQGAFYFAFKRTDLWNWCRASVVFMPTKDPKITEEFKDIVQFAQDLRTFRINLSSYKVKRVTKHAYDGIKNEAIITELQSRMTNVIDEQLDQAEREIVAVANKISGELDVMIKDYVEKLPKRWKTDTKKQISYII